MPIEVEVPEVGIVEFPDDATEVEISKALSSQFSEGTSVAEPKPPVEPMDFGQSLSPIRIPMRPVVTAETVRPELPRTDIDVIGQPTAMPRTLRPTPTPEELIAEAERASAVGIPFTKLVGETKPGEGPVIGALKGAARLPLGIGEFVTSPQGIGFAAGTAAFPAAAPGVAAYFATETIKGMPEVAKQYAEQWDTFDLGQKIDALITMAGQAGLGVALGVGAARGVGLRGPTPTGKVSPKVRKAAMDALELSKGTGGDAMMSALRGFYDRIRPGEERIPMLGGLPMFRVPTPEQKAPEEVPIPTPEIVPRPRPDLTVSMDQSIADVGRAMAEGRVTPSQAFTEASAKARAAVVSAAEKVKAAGEEMTRVAPSISRAELIETPPIEPLPPITPAGGLPVEKGPEYAVPKQSPGTLPVQPAPGGGKAVVEGVRETPEGASRTEAQPPAEKAGAEVAPEPRPEVPPEAPPSPAKAETPPSKPTTPAGWAEFYRRQLDDPNATTAQKAKAKRELKVIEAQEAKKPSSPEGKLAGTEEKTVERERLSIKPRTDGMVTLQSSDGQRIGTFKTVDEAAKSAIDLGYDIAPGSELKPSWASKPDYVTAAENATQSAYEKLGSAEKGAYFPEKRKGMTKAQLKKLTEFDKLKEAESAAKAKWKASKPTPPPSTPKSEAQYKAYHFNEYSLGVMGGTQLRVIVDSKGRVVGAQSIVRTGEGYFGEQDAIGKTIGQIEKLTGKKASPTKYTVPSEKLSEWTPKPEATLPTAPTEGKTEPGTADKIIAALKKAKVKPPESGVAANPIESLARNTYNGAIEIGIELVKAGKSIAEAVEAAVAFLRERFGSEFKLDDELKADLQDKITKQEKLPTEPLPQFSPGQPPPTAIKNAAIERDRLAMGLKPFEPVMRQEYGAVWEELKSRPEAQLRESIDNLVTDLKANPRALRNAEESAMLQYRMVELKNDYNNAAKALAKAWDDGQLTEVDRNKSIVNEKLKAVEELTDITKAAGREWGRTGVARQMFVADDYSELGLMYRKRAAKGGADLNDAELIEVQRIAAEFAKKSEAFNVALEERNKRISELEAKLALAETKAGAERERIKPRVPGETPTERLVRITDKIRNKVEKEETANITPFVKQLAEHFWLSGIRELNPMIDALHGVLKEFVPDIDRQGTMDALSGRGQFTLPSQEPVKKGIRDLSQQARLVAHQIDVEARRPLPRTGPQRDPMSDAARREQQRLNELKRKFGVVVTDPAAQLESALNAAKTYVRNRISDLRQEIATRERIVKTKTPLQPDAELNQMRAEYEALRKDWAEIFPKPELTPEQRIAAANRALDRSISSLESDIDTGRLYVPREPSKTPETPELMEKRAWLQALRDYRQVLRDIQNPKKTPGEIALASRKAYLTKRLAEYQTRIAQGDFSKKQKPPPLILTPELLDLKAQIEEVKLEFERGVERDRLAQRNLAQKTYDAAKQILNVPRNVLSSWDVSAVLRQGGFIALGHPVRAAKNIGPMFKSLVSERETKKIEQEILARDNAKNGAYARGKLYLAPQDGAKLSAQEEQLMSRLTGVIPKIYKYTGVHQSNRAYLTFLNRLRADSFDAMVKMLERPERPLTVDELKAIGNYINVATGRGKSIEQGAELLASVFFSPRLVSSRFELLAGQPMYHGTLRTRKAVATEYARFLMGAGAILGLGALAGGTVDLTDPQSADFGKIKFGNTRLDPWSGLAQVTVLGSRVIPPIVTGTAELVGLKEGYKGGWPPPKPTDVGQTIGRFIRTKLSPVVGSAIDIGTRKNVVGEPVTPSQTVQRLAVPITFQDIKQVMQENGMAGGTALEILNLFGMSVQNYQQKRRTAWD